MTARGRRASPGARGVPRLARSPQQREQPPRHRRQEEAEGELTQAAAPTALQGVGPAVWRGGGLRCHAEPWPPPRAPAGDLGTLLTGRLASRPRARAKVVPQTQGTSKNLSLPQFEAGALSECLLYARHNTRSW